MIPRDAGLVLCGGLSRRMGTSKALLPFGPETMLARIVRTLNQVVQPVLVVAAADQSLPPLSPDIQIVRDRIPNQGPLEGLAAGLNALSGHADRALVTSCDLPLLSSQFIAHLLAVAPADRVAVVASGDRRHPLIGSYPLSLLPSIERQLAAGMRRMTDLLDALDAVSLDVATWPSTLRAAEALSNVNTPEDYAHALKTAGLP